MIQWIFILLIPELFLINEGVWMFSNIVFRLGKQLLCKCFSMKKGPWLPASNGSAMSIQFWDSLALETWAEYSGSWAMGRTQPPPPCSFLEPGTYFTLATLFRIHLKKKGQEQHKKKVYEVDDTGDYTALIRPMLAAVHPGSSGSQLTLTSFPLQSDMVQVMNCMVSLSMGTKKNPDTYYSDIANYMELQILEERMWYKASLWTGLRSVKQTYSCPYRQSWYFRHFNCGWLMLTSFTWGGEIVFLNSCFSTIVFL